MSDIDAMKLRRLDFSLLLIFQEVYRSRRSTAAAERLGLSQPAVSHALGRLRDFFNDPLFLRKPAGLQPTARASELAPKVDALLAQAADIVDGPRQFNAKSTRRHFRVSANDFAGTLIMVPLLSTLASEAPQARLSLSFAGGPNQAFQQLRRGDLDIAIGRFPSVPEDCLVERLFEEKYQVLARRRHPALRSGLTLDAYLSLGHLIVSFGGDLVGTIDEILARDGRSRHVVASSPMFLSAFAAARASDLIVTAPRRLADRFARSFGLRVLDLPFVAEPFLIDMIRSRSAMGDPAVDWLVERIRRSVI
jgi:DNA-binding transcriptional LysR family regulator